ncbi:adhesion G-protein coupled receptor V1, partial [Trichonephila clavata]
KPGTFELEQPSYVVPEDARTIRVGVVRKGGTDGEIHLKYETVSNTALADQDFIPTAGELIFEEGEERKDILINILDDETKEPTETFEVQLLDPTPAPGVLNFRRFESKVTTVVTIMDNDMKPGRLELEKSVLDVLENIGTLKINVLRVGGSDGQIRTWCKTVPKSARPGSDFMPVSKELVFEEGEVRKIIEVEILDNHHKEPVRKFEVLLFEPSAGPEVNSFTGLGNKKATLVNILDNDMTPGSLQLEKSRYEVKESDEKIVIPVIRMGGNDGQIRVKLQTTPITATAKKDFPLLDQELIFREGETKKVIRIPIFDNTIRELDRTFEIHLTDSTAGSGVLNFEGLGPITRAVVTIKDDDSK